MYLYSENKSADQLRGGRGHIRATDLRLCFRKCRMQVFFMTLLILINLPHYENTPMQHTAIFHGCKNDNFQLIVLDYFHIFAQNIDCW